MTDQATLQMLAAIGEREIETTDLLIQMIAATVLVNTGQTAVTFSPADMDRVFREYRTDVAFGTDGKTTVTIVGKNGSTAPSLAVQDEDASGALEGAVRQPERPVWAIRSDGGNTLYRMLDRHDAERHVSNYRHGRIENRFCLHPDCPTSVCNRAEVTSAVDN